MWNRATQYGIIAVWWKNVMRQHRTKLKMKMMMTGLFTNRGDGVPVQARDPQAGWMFAVCPSLQSGSHGWMESGRTVGPEGRTDYSNPV